MTNADKQIDSPTRPFQTFDELSDLVLGWEQCTLPHDAWDHRAHLAVAMWHLASFNEADATERVIGGIQRYNHANGIERTPDGGYHETLTLFWLHTTRRFLSGLDPNASTLDKVNAFVEAYGGNTALFFKYYSRDRIMSWRARQTWVEPDLKPLDDDSAADALDPVLEHDPGLAGV